MAKFNVKSSFVQLAVVLAFVVASVAQKISGKIDLVIICPSNKEQDYMDAFKNSMRTMTNYIEMGPNKVRVALVEPVNPIGIHVSAANILFNFSSDAKELETWINNWTPTIWNDWLYHHRLAYKLIRDQIFDFTIKDRAKMIIHVVNGWSILGEEQMAADEAENLRNLGVKIYVSYDAKAQHLVPKIHDVAKSYTGEEYHKWRAVGSQHPDHKQMFENALQDVLKLTAEIDRDLCTYCQLDAQGNCAPAIRSSSSAVDVFGDKNARCQNVSNPTAIQCPQHECGLECDRHWEWDGDPPLCNQSCGEVKRKDPDAPEGLDDCPKTYQCPACPTTTGMSTASKAEEAAKPGSSEEPSAGAAGFQWWIIAVVIVVILLLLVIIVVAVIVSKRRKAAAKKKADEDLKKKQLEEEKLKAKKGGLSTKSGVGGSSFKGMMFAGGRGKGGEADVGASLRDDEASKVKGGKKSGMAKSGKEKTAIGKSGKEKSAVGKSAKAKPTPPAKSIGPKGVKGKK